MRTKAIICAISTPSGKRCHYGDDRLRAIGAPDKAAPPLARPARPTSSQPRLPPGFKEGVRRPPTPDFITLQRRAAPRFDLRQTKRDLKKIGYICGNDRPSG